MLACPLSPLQVEQKDITIEEVWVWNAMCGDYIKKTSAEVCWFAAEQDNMSAAI